MAVKPRPCERCGAEIPLERIEALPETRLCVRCSQEIGGEFVISFEMENVGKSNSLKKNYGSLRIRKKRRQTKPQE